MPKPLSDAAVLKAVEEGRLLTVTHHGRKWFHIGKRSVADHVHRLEADGKLKLHYDRMGNHVMLVEKIG